MTGLDSLQDWKRSGSIIGMGFSFGSSSGQGQGIRSRRVADAVELLTVFLDSEVPGCCLCSLLGRISMYCS